MSTAPARRSAPPARARAHGASGAPSRNAAEVAARARAVQRRRRERHFQRRRRDLLEDAGVALVATIVLIAETAGLGVLALLMIPLAAALVGSSVVPRLLRRRRRRARRR